MVGGRFKRINRSHQETKKQRQKILFAGLLSGLLCSPAFAAIKEVIKDNGSVEKCDLDKLSKWAKYASYRGW